MSNGLLGQLRPKNPRALRCILIALVSTTTCIIEVCTGLGLRINATNSEPIGLYMSTSDRQSDLVEFCPPEPFASLSRRRQYRPRGACADGLAPLLKSVVARAGDHVEISLGGIAVNGRALPNTTAATHDSYGRSLTPYKDGIYVVALGAVWVASTHHSRSFDSRYFGPIPVTAIRAHLRPLVTLQ